MPASLSLNIDDYIDHSLQRKRAIALVCWGFFCILASGISMGLSLVLLYTIWRDLGNVDKIPLHAETPILSYWQAAGLSALQIKNLQTLSNLALTDTAYLLAILSQTQVIQLSVKDRLLKVYDIFGRGIRVTRPADKEHHLKQKLGLCLWILEKQYNEDHLKNIDLLLDLTGHKLQEQTILYTAPSEFPEMLEKIIVHPNATRIAEVFEIPVVQSQENPERESKESKESDNFFRDGMQYMPFILNLEGPDYEKLKEIIKVYFPKSVKANPEFKGAQLNCGFFETVLSHLQKSPARIKILYDMLVKGQINAPLHNSKPPPDWESILLQESSSSLPPSPPPSPTALCRFQFESAGEKSTDIVQNNNNLQPF